MHCVLIYTKIVGQKFVQYKGNFYVYAIRQTANFFLFPVPSLS